MNIANMSYDLSDFKDQVIEHTPKMVVLENLVCEHSVHLIYHIQEAGVSTIKIRDNTTDVYYNHDTFLEKNMIRGYALVK